MDKLIEKLSNYHTHHTRKATQLTHLIGVPAVTIAFFMLLSWTHINIPSLFEISLLWPLLIATLGYYYYLDPKFGLIMTAACVPLALLSYWFALFAPNTLSLIFFLILLIGGWTLQLIGHYLEGKKPSFLSDFSNILIAPLFVASEITFIMGYQKQIQIKIVEMVGQRSQTYL